MNVHNANAEQIEASVLGQEKIDFQHYWQIIRNYQWRILSLAVAVTLLATLVVLSVTPRYVATASLLIESEEAKVLSIEEVYGLDSSRKEYFQTQFEILRSRSIAERVVDKLNLLEHPLFDPLQQDNSGVLAWVKGLRQSLRESLAFVPTDSAHQPSEAALLQARKNVVVTQFLNNLTVTPIKNTQVVNITFESQSPQLAVTVANAVADVYIESYLEAKFNMTSKATTWLNDSLQGLREKLDGAEKRLADFYEQEKLVNIDGVVGLAADELGALSEQLLNAQNTLKQRADLYEQLNQKAGDLQALSRLPVVQGHATIQSLKRAEVMAESEISELSRVYGPKHPRMIAARAELSAIQENLTRQYQTIIAGLTADYETTYRNARNKVLDLQREVTEAKARYRRLTTLDNRRRALQREVDINQQLYNSFFTRLKETSEMGGFETANARILDMATPPNGPAKPKKSLIIAVAFILSLVLGVVLALLLEALNSGIRSVEDVERRLGQKLLGILPRQALKRHQSLSPKHYFDSKNHMFSESIRTIRTNLLSLDVQGKCRVILVTSSIPKEGKSTVATNLGFAIGQLGKTLLIDADLRRPEIGKSFGLPGFQPGLANIIAGTHSTQECIVRDEFSGMDVLSAGTLPPNPQELLASSRFKRLINELRQRYSYIVVDTAPTQAVSDAVVVSESCDSLLYVVKADSTSDKVIQGGLSRFMQLGHRVDGVVLNMVDIKRAIHTGGYTGFYDPYGYQNDAMRSHAV